MDLIALDTAKEKISKDITKTMQTEGQKKKKGLKKMNQTLVTVQHHQN